MKVFTTISNTLTAWSETFWPCEDAFDLALMAEAEREVDADLHVPITKLFEDLRSIDHEDGE